MNETWVPIEGYKGSYEVSDYGRVRSLDRYRRNNRCSSVLHHGKILKPTKSGYKGSGPLQVNIGDKISFMVVKIHRLVAQHFIPNPENLPEVNHIDFNRYNNHVTNLEWVTHDENIFHAMVHGRFRASAKTHPGMAIKISNDEVETLRWLATEGVPRRELARWFSISKSHVRSIIIGISR